MLCRIYLYELSVFSFILGQDEGKGSNYEEQGDPKKILGSPFLLNSKALILLVITRLTF